MKKNKFALRFCMLALIFFFAVPSVSSFAESVMLFNNLNNDKVYNNPTKNTEFTISSSYYITYIWTYHLNNLKGKEPGQISLQHSDGTIYGPWDARPEKKGDNSVVADIAYWVVEPNVTIKPGHYTILDSDPATWSHNDSSDNRGFAYVKGRPSQSNGYSMVIFSESQSLLALAKFNSNSFSFLDAINFTQQIRQLISAHGAGSDIVVYDDSQLGSNPDAWRTYLKDLTKHYQILFLDISRENSQLSGTDGQNILVDIWYENLNMHVGSFNFKSALVGIVEN